MSSFIRFSRSPSCLFLAFALATFALRLPAQQNWQWVNPTPASVTWEDVAYGNGLYVAVGSGATIATSTDAISWTIRRMSTAQMILNGVAYANGRFVAVGVGTPTSRPSVLLMTSTDGVNWKIDENVAASFSGTLQKVYYGAGLWVVTGLAGSRLLISPDGVTWTTAVIPAGATTSWGCFALGRFVLIGGGNNIGNSVITSTDGVNWNRVLVTGTTLTTFPFLTGVAFGAGKFVAVGRDSSNKSVAYTSADGASWSSSATFATGSSAVFVTVASNGTQFVASANTEVYSSSDAITWTRQPDALTTIQHSFVGPGVESVPFVGSANGRLFALGFNGSINTSLNGTTWNQTTRLTRGDLGGLVHDGNRFVVTGPGGTVLTSTDGLNWANVGTNSSGDFRRLAYGASRYVAVGSPGIYHSGDLASWTTVPNSLGFELPSAVAYGAGRFVVAIASSNGSVARTSTNGIDWSSPNQITGANGASTNLQLFFDSGVFVVCVPPNSGIPLKIYTSSDGTRWIEHSPPVAIDTTVQSMAAGGGRFVVLTNDRQALTSPDGSTWTVNQLTSTLTLSSVSYVGTQFVARSDEIGNVCYTSKDGIDWTRLADSTGPSNTLISMLANRDTVVAIGSAGTILRADRAGRIPPGRLANMSIRTNAGTGSDTLIVGLGLGGASTAGDKPILIRGVGPTLSAFGLTGTLADPVMTVFQGTTSIAQNDDWTGTFDFASVGAFALSGTAPRDAAIYNSALPSNSYSIQIAGKNNGTGIALAEIYDATPPASFSGTTPRLINVSARAQVGTGDNILIAGFAVGGQSPVRVLIRAVGPTLGAFGVTGALVDPKLEIYSGTTKINENDNWGGTADLKAAFTSVAAFALASDTSRDAALVATLAPGAYTAQISGVGGTTGVALVELYELP